MATTNPMKEYWRNQQQKVTATPATDTSKLFAMPKNSTTNLIDIRNILAQYYDNIYEGWEVLIVQPDDFIGNGMGKNCLDNVRLQLLKKNVKVNQNAGNAFFIYFAEGNSFKKNIGSAPIDTIKQGIEYIIDEVANDRPIAVCVDYMSGLAVNRCGGDHWVTIVGMGIINDEFYFRFFDNYTSVKAYGTVKELRFYWNGETLKSRPDGIFLFSSNFSEGVLNEVVYTVTAIRKNIK